MKKLMTICLLAITLVSCSDTLGDGLDANGESMVNIVFNIATAEKMTTTTRAGSGETEIREAAVLVFSSDAADATLEQMQTFAESDIVYDEKSGTYTMSTSLKATTDDKYIVMVANPTDEILGLEEGALLSSLNAMTVSGTEAPFFMKGTKSGMIPAAFSSSMTLNRLIAKVSVTKEDAVTNFTPTGISIVNVCDEITVAGTASQGDKKGDKTVGDNTTTKVYPYPSAFNDTYIIIGGTYEGEPCYYRYDFKKEDGTALNVESNHHYELQITSVMTKGYASPEEAAKHSSSLKGTIYDHQPAVYSMATDGISELGAQDTVLIEDNAKVEVIAKWYSHDSNLENEVPTLTTEEGSWLHATGDAPTSVPVTDNGQNGKLYTFYFKADDNISTADRTTIVTIKCHGLKRTTVVKQPGLKWYDVVAVNMNMETINGGPLDNQNYYDFLTTMVEGLPEDGSRSNGIHMPRIISKYTLSPITSGVSITSCTLSDEAKEYVNLDPSSYVITCKEDKTQTPEEPKVFKKGLTIKLSDNKTVEMDIYRCGLFHKESVDVNAYKMRPGGANPDKYQYYEVIKVGGKLWLDRNLGATSPGMAVLGNEDYEEGSEAEAGSLYALPYKDSGDDPKFDKDLLNKICPDNYRLPTAAEMTLMMADHFSIQRLTYEKGAYWTPMIDNSGSTVADAPKTVYFPANKYASNHAVAGDDQAGYYWTESKALGASGSEIGYWVQYYKFIGMNATGNRIKFYTDGGNRPAMSIRCVSGEEVEKMKSIEFYVKGCTHVHLIGVLNGEDTDLTMSPGTQIAIDDSDSGSASLNMYHVFKYETGVTYDSYKAEFSMNGEGKCTVEHVTPNAKYVYNNGTVTIEQ